jgi:hypothetical protein
MNRDAQTPTEESRTQPGADGQRAPNDATWARVERDPVFNQLQDHLGNLRAKAGGAPSPEEDRLAALAAYSEISGKQWDKCSHLVLNNQGKEHAAGTMMIALRDADPYNPANPQVRIPTQMVTNPDERGALEKIESVHRQQAITAQSLTEQRTQDTALARDPNAPPAPNRSMS